ncbi:hypothetical protein SAMN05892883_3155 [Jatrophihabitans sp. GAS493]|uniref:hypothetical protein n=1 Tax=Jatrophihabitans sp. GAS493 TaxID=1907575 RepID=UPI000BB94A16|nr:hypothetical protein [Jatrophihabitans sp. GAS493]SOD73966.1 hypothetical protein SAMN05892883_3155 [Jatrophihabitans sp. GAS493]
MSLPASGLLCAWAASWLHGESAADEVLRASLGGHLRQLVQPSAPQSAGAFTAEDLLPGTEEAHTRFATVTPTSMVDVLSAWRRSGASVRCVFPVPGDVRGLPGPAAFRDAALRAGEAVWCADLGLVPELEETSSSSGATLVWRSYPLASAPIDPVPIADAAYALTEAIRETASTLAAAQVASRSARTDAALRSWRGGQTELDLPPSFPPRAVSLVAQAERLHQLLQIVALDPVGGGVDTPAIQLREQALQPLVEAVRRARVAGYNALTERDS